jgi:hypothetical protein
MTRAFSEILAEKRKHLEETIAAQTNAEALEASRRQEALKRKQHEEEAIRDILRPILLDFSSHLDLKPKPTIFYDSMEPLNIPHDLTGEIHDPIIVSRTNEKDIYIQYNYVSKVNIRRSSLSGSYSLDLDDPDPSYYHDIYENVNVALFQISIRVDNQGRITIIGSAIQHGRTLRSQAHKHTTLDLQTNIDDPKWIDEFVERLAEWFSKGEIQKTFINLSDSVKGTIERREQTLREAEASWDNRDLQDMIQKHLQRVAYYPSTGQR